MAYLPYLLAVLLLFANVGAWISNLFTLPGNWAIVLFAVLYAWLLPADFDPRLNCWVVGAAAVLALFGEAIEFFAGAAGAKKQGGSRRGMVLSLLFTIFGSILGAAIGAPVPIVGLLIGALAGAGIGAFAGAYLGEWWAGRKHQERVDISAGALVGRMLGTVGKLAIGIAMIVIITFDSFIDFS